MITGDQSWLWYISRGTALVALLMLTVAVALGVVTWGRTTFSGIPRFAWQGIHRNAAIMGSTLVAIHIVAALIQPWSQLGILNVVSPIASRSDPAAVVGVEGLTLVFVTSAARRALTPRLWRGLHLLVYPTWLLTVVHALRRGSDAATPWGMGVIAGCCSVVAVTLIWRLLSRGRRRDRRSDSCAARRPEQRAAQ